MISLKTEPGFMEKLGVGLARTGISRLYSEMRGGDNSFGKVISRGIEDSVVEDAELGVKGSLNDIASEYGFKNDLENYISREVVGGFRGRTALTLDLITSLKDTFEDTIEGAELIVVTANIPTGSFAPLEAMVNLGQGIVYAINQSVYTALAGLLGYLSGTYTLDRKGSKNYVSDVFRGYLGVALDIIPVSGGAVEFGTNIDDKRGRMIDSFSRKTGTWLLNQIRESKGMPLLEYDRDLAGVTKSAFSRLKGKISNVKLRKSV